VIHPFRKSTIWGKPEGGILGIIYPENRQHRIFGTIRFLGNST